MENVPRVDESIPPAHKSKPTRHTCIVDRSRPGTIRLLGRVSAADIAELVLSDGTVATRLEIVDAVIPEAVALRQVRFARDVAITRSQFYGSVDFEHAEFSEGLRIWRTTFRKTVSLHGARVHKDFSAADNTFEQRVDFSDLAVELQFDASRSKFRGPAKCRHMTVGGETKFVGSTFAEYAHFNSGQFRGEATFEDVRFAKEVNFEDAIFEGWASFDSSARRVKILGDAIFHDTHFKAGASFSGLDFKGKADFQRANFGRDALFGFGTDEKRGRPVVFRQLADFYSLECSGSVTFIGAAFNQDAQFTLANIGIDAFFQDAIFRGTANFQAASIGYDAYFRGVKFQGGAQFDEVTIGRSAYFDRSDGQSTIFSKEADFSLLRCTGPAIFSGAHFKRSASFPRAAFGNDANFDSVTVKLVADFTRARFEGLAFFRPEPSREVVSMGDAVFSGAYFADQAEFVEVTFELSAGFDSAHFLHNVFFDEARFGGIAEFGRARVGRDMYFRGAQFQKVAIFDAATVGGNAYFLRLGGVQVTFEETASFASFSCSGSADFSEARFRQGVTMALANIGRDIYFQGSKFHGSTNFQEMMIGGDAYFYSLTGTATTFRGNTDFRGARFADQSDFTGVIFGPFPGDESGPSVSDTDRAALLADERAANPAWSEEPAPSSLVTFDEARFGGRADFTRTLFAIESSFAGTDFIAEARFVGTQFSEFVDFSAAEVGRLVSFEGAVFGKDVSFRDAHLQAVIFDDYGEDPPNLVRTVAGRWCTCFAGGPLRSISGWLPPVDPVSGQFIGKVDLTGLTYDRIKVDWPSMLDRVLSYTRQSYTELEGAYRRKGDDRAANRIYFARWDRELSNRLQSQQWRDRFLSGIIMVYRQLAGYGVRPARLGVSAAVILALGTIVFSQLGAVVNADASTPLARAELIDLDRFHAFMVSLDELLPIELAGGSRWEPSNNLWWEVLGLHITYTDFAGIMSLAGWILIPITIGVIASTLRRQL